MDAMAFRSACGYALQLRWLLPVTTALVAIGTGMERQREISLPPDEDYAQKARRWLTDQYLFSKDNNQ